MKTRRFLLTILPATTPHLLAQPFGVTWFTLDDGGGTSTGGVFSVSGTIGQPDAGTMSGGSFTVVGGFWSVASVQAIAPRLFIQRSNDVVVIWWEPATAVFVLQSSASLSPAAWTNAPSGGTNPTTVPLSGASRFFHLNQE
jgi:hypothetical protein